MALLNTVTEDNRAIDTALRVVYSRRKIYGAWTYVSLNVTVTITEAWEYLRTATKSYRYVGLDEATANAAVAALQTLYTRSTKVSQFDTAEGSPTYGNFKAVAAGDVPMADVVAQHEEGDMWSVVISVNEADARISLSASESFASLFSSENQRDYDTSAAGPIPPSA